MRATNTAIELQHGLRRRLGLPLLVLYGTGTTIGAGIYVLVGAVAGRAGAYAAWSFVLAAAVMALTVTSYAELATRYPVSAGEAADVAGGLRLPAPIDHRRLADAVHRGGGRGRRHPRQRRLYQAIHRSAATDDRRNRRSAARSGRCMGHS